MIFWIGSFCSNGLFSHMWNPKKDVPYIWADLNNIVEISEHLLTLFHFKILSKERKQYILAC